MMNLRKTNRVISDDTNFFDESNSHERFSKDNTKLHVQIPANRLSVAASATNLHEPKRIHLKLFVNETTFAERLRFYFIKNQTTSLRIRLFKFIVKLVTVILYVVETATERPNSALRCSTFAGSHIVNNTWKGQYDFSWEPIIWVRRHVVIWCMQVVLAVVTFLLEIINTCAHYKGNLAQQLISVTWFLEFFCMLPFVISIFWSPLRCIFVPVFLNIWLAKSGLESMINDLHRAAHKQQSAMFNQVFILFSTIICLFVTCVCGVEHLERAGQKPPDLYDSFWFVVVTFSTVGYGDITPTIWPSRLLVIIIIFVSLGILPSQLEQLSFVWAESKRHGGEYSRQRAKTEKHVVVCATVLRMDVILEFLNEFYAHPTLQKYYVVLLSPGELDAPLKRFLQIPIWAERVIYIQGSVLRDQDSMRVKMDAAEACFILTSRLEVDRLAADEKTILRAMAVKDFAPNCPLFVQILRPESMLHVQFADKVICDEEIKHALLAMNSYIPGISTLVTLLAHTSKGQDGETLNSAWKTEFGKSAGNEIYSVIAQDSKFFSEYVGNQFSISSMRAHSKCGATLFAVERSGAIQINPGNNFIIESTDTLFYICLTREEDAMIVNNKTTHQGDFDSHNTLMRHETLQNERPSSTSDIKHHKEVSLQVKEEETTDAGNPHMQFLNQRKELSSDTANTTIGFPPASPYVGYNTPTMCHILKEKSKLCCLRLDRTCEHCRFTSALHYNWPNPPIIVSAEFAPQSLFNVMVPLRAHYRKKSTLHPIVLLLEHSPEQTFLNAISCFPMVYYILGSMNKLDSLLHAGVTYAHILIILDRETSMYADEAYMADSKQLVATQTMYRLFPDIRTCLELTHASNMRFMHFEPQRLNNNADEVCKEKEGDTSNSVPYLFRETFASGKVFSSSMLDTLLYQSFIKDYLTSLLRIMLGLQYTAGSGHLDTYKIMEKDEGKTYNEVFRFLSKNNGCIILGIYRMENKFKSPLSSEVLEQAEKIKFSTSVNIAFGGLGTLANGQEVDGGSDENEIELQAKRRTFKLSSSKRSQSIKNVRKKQVSLRRMHLINSNKSDREKLNDMIQYRMKELNLTDATHENMLKSQISTDKFGYILLNPAPDVVLKKGDMLYIISPEMGIQENCSFASMSEINDNCSLSDHCSINMTQAVDHTEHDEPPKNDIDSFPTRSITSINEESGFVDYEALQQSKMSNEASTV